MYRILLAEDEPEVLNSIISTIDWAHFGFEPPVGCGDGKEAIEHIEGGFHPHAIITDINMPLKGGLELAEYVSQHFPQTLVVILSGYDDFTFAQHALRLQVYDYILKPVTPHKMQKLLSRIQNEIYTRQLNDPEDTLKIGEGDFLLRLLSGPMDAAVITESLKRYQLHFAGRYSAATVLDIDETHPSEDAQDKTDELLRYGLHNIAAELMSSCANVCTAVTRGSQSWLIVSADTRAAVCENAKKYARQIATTVQHHLKITISAGIGQPVEGAGSLYLSHDSAEKTLRHRFYFGSQSILCYDEITPPHSALPFDYPALESRFKTCVNAFETDQALAVLSEVFTHMSNTRLGFDSCVKYSQRLVLLLLRFADSFVDDDEMITLEAAWEHHHLYETVFISQMQALVKQFCEQVFELIALVCNDSTSAQIARAEGYIRQNFANPKLSLQMLTDYLAVSTSYFSSVFKARTGATFVEYLTKLRMETAKNILAHTQQRTYEVAEEVGFSDPHYFSAAFKKSSGMTPKEYRAHSKNEKA